MRFVNKALDKQYYFTTSCGFCLPTYISGITSS